MTTEAQAHPVGTAARPFYAGLNVVMIFAWGWALGTVGSSALANLGGFGVTLIAALLWNAASYPRCKAVRMRWLHAAPYLAILGLFLLVRAGAQSEGQFADGPHIVITPLDTFLAFASYPLLLAWPLATLYLSFAPSRPRPVHVEPT